MGEGLLGGLHARLSSCELTSSRATAAGERQQFPIAARDQEAGC